MMQFHQKQPQVVLFRKRCSSKFHSIHRKTSVLVSDGLKACDFIKKRLQDRCFPVSIVKFLRTPILKNICEWLFLF